jgi:hypothetical protein
VKKGLGKPATAIYREPPAGDRQATAGEGSISRLTLSDPPTRAQAQEILTKLNQLRRPPALSAAAGEGEELQNPTHPTVSLL